MERMAIDWRKLLRCMLVEIGPKRQFLRRNHTSEVGGEADMPRQSIDAFDPYKTSLAQRPRRPKAYLTLRVSAGFMI